ncbi:MAG: 23S rRNA (pseudouridine(1915)-N(3))-methyltransferase RlmH [Bacteroidia bacterium]|nr:23S rRNA (pseudouridine(1915)-N(3))-methyltransferase RlmH [Bacteroidia bacterium]
MVKVTLLQLGKTHFKFVDDGFAEFSKRLIHYCKFESKTFELPTKLKSKDTNQTKKAEADIILKNLKPTDFVILLDENGKTYSSVQLAKYIENLSVQQSSLVFIIGGAYGFDESIYQRANAKISLSACTFSHQLIRLIFI